jgi:hypothetical protein
MHTDPTPWTDAEHRAYLVRMLACPPTARWPPSPPRSRN